MSVNLEEGRLIKVTFECRLPKAATEEEVEKWVAFTIGANGIIPHSNPLIDDGFDIWDHDVEITRYIGRVERLNERKVGDATQYTLRRHRDRAS